MRVTLITLVVCSLLSFASQAHAGEVCDAVVQKAAKMNTSCDGVAEILEWLAADEERFASFNGEFMANKKCGEAFMAIFEVMEEKKCDENDRVNTVMATLKKMDRAYQASGAKGSEPESAAEFCALIANGAIGFYQSEHASADGLSVTTRQYPVAEEQICNKRQNEIWTQLHVKQFMHKNNSVCYQSDAAGKNFAAAAWVADDIYCVRGSGGDGGPEISDPEKVDSTAACKVSGSKKTSTTSAPTKTKTAKKVEKKAVAKAPAQADVEAFCGYWEESVDKFGKDCSALGKRIQRKSNSLSFKLRDVPRTDKYSAALEGCARAAKATASCASDKEVKTAMDQIGN